MGSPISFNLGKCLMDCNERTTGIKNVSWGPARKICVKYRTSFGKLKIYIAIANAQHLLEHASINLPFIG